MGGEGKERENKRGSSLSARVRTMEEMVASELAAKCLIGVAPHARGRGDCRIAWRKVHEEHVVNDGKVARAQARGSMARRTSKDICRRPCEGEEKYTEESGPNYKGGGRGL